MSIIIRMKIIKMHRKPSLLVHDRVVLGWSRERKASRMSMFALFTSKLAIFFIHGSFASSNFSPVGGLAETERRNRVLALIFRKFFAYRSFCFTASLIPCMMVFIKFLCQTVYCFILCTRYI